MGKRERQRKARVEQEKSQKKQVIEKVRKEKYPWLTPWRRADFWVYTICVVLILAFPFIKKDALVLGDQAIIHTTKGDIEVAFYGEDAPKAVENFTKLAAQGYYDKTIFHRVIKGFMIQGGDPTGTGTGGDSIWGQSFEDEINPDDLGLSQNNLSLYESKGYHYNRKLHSHKVQVGSLAMANSGPDTNGSQFFIVTEQDQPHLDGQHTVFGHVIAGLDVAKAISEVAVDSNDKPIESVSITSIELK